MPPDSRDAQEWLDKAALDRSAALRLFTPGCQELSVIGFLCQQCAEKLLKAYLVSEGEMPERIHDLRRLLDSCARHDADLLALADAASTLNVYAVIARYPGPAEPSQTEIAAAIEAMEHVRGAIQTRLAFAD